MAQPLPSLAEAGIKGLISHGYPNAYPAYYFILTVEEGARDNKHLVRVRTLGYLLLYPMSTTARDSVASEVMSCKREKDAVQSLDELGGLYVNTLLTLFKRCRGEYPYHSEHSSRPSFCVLQERYRTLLVEGPRDYSSARKQALLRDNYRCMVTRALDVFLAQYPELMKGPEPRYPNALECCYIFPEALGQSNSINSAAKEYHVESVWTTLERFGHSGLLDELSGTNIHRLDNVMTLTVSVCRLFDSMSLWFEEVRGKENCYAVKLAPGGFNHASLGIPEEVHFVAYEQLPLPNTDYLRIHATCCRVAHMSGAAAYFDEVLRDMEDVGVLTEDGSSADLLGFLLHRAAIVPLE